MEIVKSYFTHNSKCSSCQTSFSISSKRRACKICSNKNSENLFCKNCSTSIRHPYLGILKSKRYCNTCFNQLDTKKKSEAEELPHQRDFNRKLSSHVKIMKKNPSKDFFIINKIGQGATGSVFKGEKVSNGQKVAIKQIELSPNFDKTRVVNEIGIMQLTIHPNIIQCYSAYEFQK